MKLLDKASRKTVEAAIVKLVDADYENIERGNGFYFDWKLESKNDVFKIYLVEEFDSILGLISLKDVSSEWRIHINLIEVNSENIGKTKRFDHIAGCLIAFACALSFKKGYGGFISLLPKTKLIDLYQDKYGFRQFGRMLALQFEQAQQLIEKYFGDEAEV